MLCGIPALGWGSGAVPSRAVLWSVFLCCWCCAPLSCVVAFPAVFLSVVPGFPLVLWAVSVWGVLQFGLVVLCCALVLVFAALCRLVLYCAVACLIVLWCVVCFVAVLLSRFASSAAVAFCCALFLSSVLCCPAVLPVVQVLSFIVLCFLALLVSWRLLCGAVLACLRPCFVRGALLLLWRWLVPCIAACHFVGVPCWVWLSAVVSWWLPVACIGVAVTVWSCGPLFCGFVWCVLVLWSPVLFPVDVCCLVVVCCRALLSVCVAACACCFFSSCIKRLLNPSKCFFWK